MSARKIQGLVAILVVFAGGCNLVLGLEHRELYQPDGGGGTTSTANTDATGTDATGTGGTTSTCKTGQSEACYDGPPGTNGNGLCASGTRGCGADGVWGACMGAIKPQQETCANPADEDCDGFDCVQWSEVFGSLTYQGVNDIAIDTSGDAYVVGSFQGAFPLPTGTLAVQGNEVAAFLLKLAPSGKPQWGIKFSSSNQSVSVLSVALDSTGNAFVGGASSGAQMIGSNSIPPGAFVAKVSSDGKAIWGKGLTTDLTACTLGVGSDLVHSVATTPQGDLVIGGTYCAPITFGDGTISPPPAMFSYYGFAAKLRGSDGSGKAADGFWGRSLCPAVGMENERCEVTAVAVDADSNVILTGDFSNTLTLAQGAILKSNKGSGDIFLTKLTTEGIPIWKMQIGDDQDQFPPTDLAIGTSGGPVLVGYLNGSADFGGGNVITAPVNGIGYVAEYAPDMLFKWDASIPANPNGVAVDAKGNVVLVGGFKGSIDFLGAKMTSMGDADVFVAKLSSAGQLVWSKSYGGSASDDARGVAVTSAGEPIVVGNTEGTINLGRGPLMSAGSSDVFAVKLSP